MGKPVPSVSASTGTTVPHPIQTVSPVTTPAKYATEGQEIVAYSAMRLPSDSLILPKLPANAITTTTILIPPNCASHAIAPVWPAQPAYPIHALSAQIITIYYWPLLPATSPVPITTTTISSIWPAKPAPPPVSPASTAPIAHNANPLSSYIKICASANVQQALTPITLQGYAYNAPLAASPAQETHSASPASQNITSTTPKDSASHVIVSARPAPVQDNSNALPAPLLFSLKITPVLYYYVQLAPILILKRDVSIAAHFLLVLPHATAITHSAALKIIISSTPLVSSAIRYQDIRWKVENADKFVEMEYYSPCSVMMVIP
jgi:hypothetical protein